MIEITIVDNLTKITTSDLHVIIDGSFLLKKEGAEAPIINVIANSQQELVQSQEVAKNA